MRFFDWFGVVHIAAGLSGVWMGHRHFELIWYRIGFYLVSLGCVVVVTEVRRRRQRPFGLAALAAHLRANFHLAPLTFCRYS